MGKTTKIDAVIASNLRQQIGDQYGVQKKLALKVKITPGTLNRILQGKQHAGPEVVADLAAELGVPETAIYQEPTSADPIFSDALRLLALFGRAEPSDRAAAISLLQRAVAKTEDAPLQARGPAKES